MKIDPKFPSDLQTKPFATRAVRDGTPTDGSRIVAASPADAPAQGDTVELSEQARLLAQSSTLSPDRIREIRQRIDAGVYDSPATADAVARSMLVSGDL